MVYTRDTQEEKNVNYYKGNKNQRRDVEIITK